MVNINKNCLTDTDCDKDKICAFDEINLEHYCINNNKSNLYYGCLNDNNNFESTENKFNNLDYDIKDCIDFSRRQLNKDNIEHNYMIYKPKKNIFIDTTTINIYLKCNKEILAIIPYLDYFNIKCDDNKEICILESKKSLLNFIIQNSKNCIENIYLEIIYECENEGLEKILKIPIDIENFNELNIELKCPINNNNYKSKCESIYINPYLLEKDNYNELIDINISTRECENPLFKVPRLVKNINNYKRLKTKNSKDELSEYDIKINEKIEDLKKLEAEKYVKLKKLKNGIDITLEESYDIINKSSLDKLINNNLEDWKIYENYDAIQNLFEENEKNELLTYYGKVYTLDLAIEIANENSQNYFVWYHNSYEVNDFASKLYFIDIFYGNQDLLKKSNWIKHENVTTCVSKYDIETFVDLNLEEESINNNKDILIGNLIDIFKKKDEYNGNIYDDIGEIINNSMNNSQNIYNNVNKYLDDKITTYGQAISMNNYEENINNKILKILSFVSIIMIIIFIFLLAYINYNYYKTS